MGELTLSFPPTRHPPSFLCSVIVPVHNASQYLTECLQSVLSQQQIPLDRVQLILYDDASADDSFDLASRLVPTLTPLNITLLRGKDGPLGVGSARNRACEHAKSPILVFLDADDVMRPQRLRRSLDALREADIVGGVFDRIPAGSTPRYEAYHRRLATADLFAHAFRDAPLAMPTIACRHQVWQSVRFKEGRGVPEDLHFLYDGMRKGYVLVKLQGESIAGYRFHPGMTSLTLHRRVLLDVRIRAFEDLVLTLPQWKQGFSIWNSGRDGKEVFKRLSDQARGLLRSWGDINPKKIGKVQHGCQVVHFSQLQPPIACCVVLDREGREFEANLASLELRPGVDYVHLV